MKIFFDKNITRARIYISILYSGLIYSCLIETQLRILAVFKEENKQNKEIWIEDDITFHNLITNRDKIIMKCAFKNNFNKIILLNYDADIIKENIYPQSHFCVMQMI